ncbi:phage-related protein [Arthrobacter silviterrae]|uniref:Phage tail tape measure protein n=1 Tax=Arthrobacter silviterrae TaxID=2026658 RepID=A0ABX0DBE7_9MICC|nr:phage tail tape measure protein [Arthrobacter silviterrae]MDQ0275742.1 phage-related protein [Arthrobacter silviterrae]NGN83160.1 phage tail tape measure protein [Arthrobacter silviterrae]
MGLLPPLLVEITARADQVFATFHKVNAEADAMAKKTSTAADRSAASWHRMQGASKAMAIGTAASALIVGTASIEAATKFEKSTTLLVTAGGESKTAIGAVRDGILAIASSTGTSTAQLSEGMYVMEKAGYRGADGLKVLKAAAQGAKAENVDLATMTQAVSDVMIDYHKKAGDAVSVTNSMVTASGLAKTTMQDFAGSMASIIPIGSSMGLSFAQLGGAIATMTQHGESAQQSTQNLANLVQNLSKPSSIASSAMNQLGINVTDLTKNLGTRGLTGTMKIVTDAITNHMGPAGLVVQDIMKKSANATQDLTAMMGKMPPELAKASQAFMDGTISQKEYQKTFKGMGAEGSAMGKQFLTLAQTTKGYNDQIKGGTPQFQTYNAMLSKMTGGITGLKTSLMLTGENTASFNKNVAEIGKSAKKSGSDIATWGDTSSTTAVKLDQVKETVGVLGIKIGGILLPIVKNAADVFLGFVKYLSQNKGVALGLGIALGTLAVGLSSIYVVTKLVKVAQEGWAIATKLAAGAQWLLNAALTANPIGLVVLAIAALVGGFILAYNKIGWFKDGVNAAFKFVKDVIGNVGNWFTGTLVPMWNTAVASVGKFFGDVGHTIGDIMGGISTVIGNVVGFIGKHWKLLLALVLGPLGLIIDFIATNWTSITKTFSAVWKAVTTVTSAAWKGISDVIGGAYNWIKNNVINLFKLEIKGWGAVFTWLWKDIVSPVFSGIRDVMSTAWNWVKANVIDRFVLGLQVWGDRFTWLWKNIVVPVFDGIRNVMNTGWQWIDHNVFTPFKTGISAIGTAFDATQKFIGTAWDKIKDAAAKPVHWIVDTIYTGGIKKVWDGIATAVGIDLHLPDAPKFANGGVAGFAGGGVGGINPGYRPGHDSIPAMTSPGEAWMVPEWTKAVGADNVHRWNRLARHGGPGAVRKDMGFAEGGIAHFTGGGVAGLLGGIGSAIGGAVNNVSSFVSGAFKDVAGFLSDPLGSIMKLIMGPVKALAKSAPGGDLGKLAMQLPIDVVTGLGAKVKELLGGSAGTKTPGGSGGGTPGNSSIGGTAQWSSMVLKALFMMGQPDSLLTTTLRRMNQESGGNANAINLTDSNAAAGIPSKGLMQVIDPTFAAYAMPGYSSNIYDPMSNILASMHYAISRYGSLAGAYNRPGGYALGGVVPVFDQGGMVPPGKSMIDNQTGAWERLSNTTDGGGGQTINNYNYVTTHTNATGPQIAGAIGWALARQS